MSVRFDGRVAIVTGAGGGLGRCHALGLAARGAKVVVNDLGPGGKPSETTLKVVEEIVAAGGEALANGADITEAAQVAEMVADAERRWGKVDILVNNAGILRDKSFAKMEMADFELVVKIHLLGSALCAKAVWNGMRERNYGRILFTSSASGIYGNFGQANYGAAKAAMIGLMNVLHIEGQKNNVRVNTLAPTALTRMTEGLLPKEAGEVLTAESVTPAVLFLVGEDAPFARHHGRRRRRLRRHPHRGDAGRLSAGGRAHARRDRRAFRGNLRPRESDAARQRVPADVQVRQRPPSVTRAANSRS